MPVDPEQPPLAEPITDPDATAAPDAGDPASVLVDGVPADLIAHPRYRVTRLLGQGGMGAVYQAEHRMMDRTVALKVIHPRFTANPAAIERFHREVRSAARLHHVNIVTAHDAERAGETHFLVMEYVEGVTLSDLLRERGPLPVHEACDHIRQACLGLQHAHEKSMVHRDIKPDNLMLADDGTVKILDFGLARLGEVADVNGFVGVENDGQLTAVGCVMGTPNYMAPEQARDAHSADIRADLYSLGCSLYQLLTGRVPFPEGSTLDKVNAHAHQKPMPLAALRPKTPPALVAVVEKLMAKRPDDRYATPAEVADALAPFAKKPAKRRGVVVPIVAASVIGLVTLVGLAIGAISWRDEAKQTPLATSAVEPETFALPDPVELAARPSPADALKRADISLEALTLAGNGDPKAAPPELVAVFGNPRWRTVANGVFAGWRADGKEVALGDGRKIRIFSADGRCIRELVGHTSQHCTIRYSPNGKWLASTGFDSSVRVWDATTGAEKHVWREAYGMVWCLAWSPNSEVVAASGPDGVVYRWNLATNKRLSPFRGHVGQVYGLAFSPDGKSLVSAGKDGKVRFWSTETDQVTRTLTLPNPGEGHILAAFHPDGDRLALGSDSQTCVVDLSRPEAVKCVFSRSTPGAGLLAWTPDGKSLWTAPHAISSPSQQRVAIRWNLPNGSESIRCSLPSAQKTYDCWALNPDGSRLVMQSNENIPTVFDTATGQPLEEVGHRGAVHSVAFRPDGQFLASSGGNDGTLRLWEVSTGRQHRVLSGHNGRVHRLAWAPDGRLLASSCWDGAIRLWDAGTGSLSAALPHGSAVDGVAFSVDGKRLAVGLSDHSVRVWDVASRVQTRDLRGHTGVIVSVCFDRTGRQLASAAADGTVRVWDVEGAKLMRVFRAEGVNHAVVGSLDNLTLASSGDDTFVRFWKWNADGEASPALSVGQPACCAAVSPDGRLVVSSDGAGWLHLWDRTVTPPRHRKWALRGWEQFWQRPGITMSPEGRYIASGNPDGTVDILRLAERGTVPGVASELHPIELERVFEGHTHQWVHDLGIAPDGKSAWTGSFDKTLRYWRIDDARETRKFDLPFEVFSLAVSPDGSSAVVGGLGGQVRRLALSRTKPAVDWRGGGRSVTSLAWSPDGQRVVAGLEEGQVRIWDAANDQLLNDWVVSIGPVYSVAWVPSNRVLTSSKDGVVALWDVATQRVVRKWEGLAVRDGSTRVCVSPDGQRAAWGVSDGTVRIVDLKSGDELYRLRLGDEWTRGIAFSPDGKRLLAGGGEGALVLWDAESGQEIDRTRTFTVIQLAFLPDGRRAVTTHNDGKARVWRLP